MQVLWIIFLLLLGACVGSFLNVVVYRLPRGQSIVFPPSHCPTCGRAIRWYDNIPILSWLLLRGRCRFCKCRISPRYILVEAATAGIVVGLYLCYFVAGVREDLGQFAEDWPAFAVHAALLCGLLAVSLVDIELWIIPLEVMWFCAAAGLVAASAAAHPLMPGISPDLAGVSFAAAAGLGVAMLLMRLGLIQPSFIDASDRPILSLDGQEPSASKGGAKGPKAAKPVAVATTSAHGVDPRKEVLRELLFLAPAIGLAAAAWLVLSHVPSAAAAWRSLLSVQSHPSLAPRLLAAGSAVLGFLVGGLWVWGMRILGTIAFGKEAMGMGDVHIMAAVGAVTGWFVPSVAFFVAPVFGLAWAVYLWLAKGQRELPYGPWLAAATGIVMIFHDAFAELLGGYVNVLRILWQ